ncbi:uncharacterized protein LOC119695630 isoform X3 [Motacilla alba alba]|uniref:uncharacterized protein LOC119695630 isoform X3 n=1 Tax=Motacilla alba alba TaxID=1094192 RepID=UPI0018D546AB|nr:uncharacterized protein LOC119695630 isoform X3 [Motacilla alba alba]
MTVLGGRLWNGGRAPGTRAEFPRFARGCRLDPHRALSVSARSPKAVPAGNTCLPGAAAGLSTWKYSAEVCGWERQSAFPLPGAERRGVQTPVSRNIYMDGCIHIHTHTCVCVEASAPAPRTLKPRWGFSGVFMLFSNPERWMRGRRRKRQCFRTSSSQ